MYLPVLYNRVSSGMRSVRPACAAGFLLAFVGCESTSGPPRSQASTATGMAPTSDVRRVDAFQDAERVARAGTGRAAVVGKGASMAPIYGDTTMLVITRLPYDQLASGMVVAYRNQR